MQEIRYSNSALYRCERASDWCRAAFLFLAFSKCFSIFYLRTFTCFIDRPGSKGNQQDEQGSKFFHNKLDFETIFGTISRMDKDLNPLTCNTCIFYIHI